MTEREKEREREAVWEERDKGSDILHNQRHHQEYNTVYLRIALKMAAAKPPPAKRKSAASTPKRAKKTPTGGLFGSVAIIISIVVVVIVGVIMGVDMSDIEGLVNSFKMMMGGTGACGLSMMTLAKESASATKPLFTLSTSDTKSSSFGIKSSRVVYDNKTAAATVVVDSVSGTIIDIVEGDDDELLSLVSYVADFGDLVIMPGLVDAHVHCNEVTG